MVHEAGPERRGRGRRILASGALAVCATLVALGIGEAALRLAGFSFYLFPRTIEFGWPDPESLASGYVPHPRLLWAPRDYQERVARAAATPPDILFMGDSCTELGDYDVRLRELIRERSSLGQVRTANFGVSGWSSFQGRQQFTHEIVEIRPRIVTVYFGWNDHWVGFEASDAEARIVGSPLYARLRELRVFQLLTRAWFQAVRPPSRPLRVSPAEFEDNLRSIAETARSHGIEVLLLTAPTSHRRGSEPAYLEERWIENLDDLVPLHQEYVEITRRVARETGTPLCDLARRFRDEVPESSLGRDFMEDGIHLTAEGNQKVAEFLFDCFAESSLLEALSSGARRGERTRSSPRD
jgi:lysophospholipase L1-like esterase